MSIKVLHLIGSLEKGGAQVQLRALIDSTVNDVTHKLYVTNEHSDIIHRKFLAEVIYAPKFSFLRSGLFVKALVKEIDLFKPHVVHLWLPERLTLPAAITIRLKYRGLYLVGSSRRRPNRSLSVLAFKDILSQLAYVFCDYIIANYNYSSSGLIGRLICKTKPVEVIYNGYDYSCTKKNELDTIEQFLFVGRFVSQKGINTLIHAARLLSDRDIRPKIYLIGSGPKLDEMKTLTKFHGLTNIIFIGADYNWCENEWRKTAFVFPSLLEGMPNVLFEAVGKGMPLIASNIDEVSLHFKGADFARLVKPQDPVSFAESMEAFIDMDRDEVISMGTAMESFMSRYTKRIMAKKTLGVYRKSLSKC